jgi:hypothetical protein
MSYIELIIKIPEEAKQAFDCAESNDLKGCYYDHGGVVGNAIKNGTPLPKGHGRIMDVDKIIKKMEEREEQLKDDRSIWETAGVETALDMFGETIIEADKAESEEMAVINNRLKDLSERVENIEKQIKEEKEEQLRRLQAQIDYAELRCSL